MQQENGLIELDIRTTIDGAHTIIVDSGLSFYLWTKSISTMFFMKNKSSFLAIQKGKITPKEIFLQ